MVANILGFPILVLALIVQMAVVSRLPLLHGTADLILLILSAWSLQERVNSAWVWAIIGGVLVSIASALPSFTPLVGYLLVTAIARLLQKNIWQTPILAMFTTVFLGTLITHAISFVVLRVTGSDLSLMESLRLVTLPSALLNMLLAIPAYALFKDLASWLYPAEIEI